MMIEIKQPTIMPLSQYSRKERKNNNNKLT